jgi:prevent-host-death family protein
MVTALVCRPIAPYDLTSWSDEVAMGVERKGRWKLEDAKARFSELVRKANSEGPQTVTVRGREAAVVLSAKAYEKLRPTGDRLPLLDFLRSLDLSGLDLTREPDYGRDVEL